MNAAAQRRWLLGLLLAPALLWLFGLVILPFFAGLMRRQSVNWRTGLARTC